MNQLYQQLGLKATRYEIGILEGSAIDYLNIYTHVLAYALGACTIALIVKKRKSRLSVKGLNS